MIIFHYQGHYPATGESIHSARELMEVLSKEDRDIRISQDNASVLVCECDDPMEFLHYEFESPLQAAVALHYWQELRRAK